MNKKKILIIALIAILSIGDIIIWATGTQDYRTVQFYDDNDKDIFKPTAQFSLTHNGTSYNSPVGADLDSFASVVYATVGDTVSIKDLSHSNRGKTLKAWDFQYTRPDDKNQFINTKAFEKSYDLDMPGTYTFSLCVRDTVEDEAWTSYWGNWSENGNHQVIGHNPGKKLDDPSDDFDGYWYFTRIVVIASEKTYSLEEKHIDTNSGTVLSHDEHNGITSSSYTTRSKSFDGYDFIGSRAGYTWSEIANGTTKNISSRTANFDSSHKVAFHYYYYQKSTPPPPPAPGKADIVVYYKDKVSGAAVYPEDTSLTGVDYGTYTIEALPAPEGYTFDAATPSPQVITVDAANNYRQVTFYYKPDSAPAMKPPVVVLTAPEEVICGNDFRVDASQSYAKDGATIVEYIWDINSFRASYPPIKTSDKRVTLWSDDLDECYDRVSVTIIDSNGMTATDSVRIHVIQPTPVAKVDITGNLKENRKITASGLNSLSGSKRFNIIWSKCIWNIVPSDGSNIKTDEIKTLTPYTIENGTVKIQGVSSFDFLVKNHGDIKVKLYIWSEPNWL